MTKGVAAHSAAVEPNKTPQLPEGGTSFRSEVHPPLLMAIGGTRVLTPTDVRTRIVLTSRPFLARQVYVVDTDRIGDDGAADDGTLLQHLDHEIGKLSPDWWQLGIPDSVTVEAHPQIAAKPFDGVHVAAFTVRPRPTPPTTSSWIRTRRRASPVVDCSSSTRRAWARWWSTTPRSRRSCCPGS